MKTKKKTSRAPTPGKKRKMAGADPEELHEKAKKRKKTLQQKIEGPTEADKLLPPTLEERMFARRVVVILEKCCLENVQPRKGALELLNSDDHKKICAKNGRDLADVRPDITHQCLMTLLDSPLNKAGKLLIYLHTSRNVLIEVHPSLRVPRTFKRFAGLCVELLERRKIRASTSNTVLMKVVANPVEKYLPPGSRRFGLSVGGRKVKLRDFTASLEKQAVDERSKVPVVFAIGAVAQCDPVTEATYGKAYTEENISICEWGLSASCCCAKICTEFEHLWDIC